MNTIASMTKAVIAGTFVLNASMANADRKQDAFYLVLDRTADNPMFDPHLQHLLLDMVLADARNRGLGLADTIHLRTDRIVAAWNEDLVTSRAQPPESLSAVLLQRLSQVPAETGASRIMRLLQTTGIDCSVAETTTIYVLSNIASSLTVDDENGANLQTAPLVSYVGCRLVWVGATLGSPDLSLLSVLHIDDLLEGLSAHFGADDHAVIR